MGKRSKRVVSGLYLAVSVVLTSPGWFAAAHGTGYLNTVGPVPLRYQSATPAEIKPITVIAAESPAAAPAPSPVPSEPPTPPSHPPVAAPKVLVSPPNVLQSLLLSPLWASICDGIFGVAPSEVEAGDKSNSKEEPATVTPEMLAEFFKQPEATVEPSAKDTPAPSGDSKPASSPPAAVFVLPSSQAIYRSQ